MHMWTGALNRIFKRSQGLEAKLPPSVPAGQRVYAIGDIHGRADLLDQLLSSIEADAAASPDYKSVIVFLGDYVDRGLQSKEVLDRLSSGMPRQFETVFLKGNHEEAVLHFLEDAQFANTWKYYGGLETLHSYGVTEISLSDDPLNFENARVKFDQVLPYSHKLFLAGLQSSYTLGDYFFAHAGIRPGVPLSRQLDEDLLWIRSGFIDYDGLLPAFVVHGHTPSTKVETRHNRIGIDTGAYMSGVLTCLVLEGSGRRVIQT